MKRVTRLVPVLLVVLVLFSLSLPATLAAPLAQTGPQTFTALAGGETDIQQLDTGPAGAWQMMHFYPNTITVNVGDSVLWKINSTEFHTVTFLQSGQARPNLVLPEGGTSQRLLLNPLVAFPTGGPTYNGTEYVNSGLLQPNAPPNPVEFKLTFAKAGEYNYTCLVHPGMDGKVVVQPAGSPYPQTQAQIDAEAKAQIAADQQAVAAAKAQANQAPGSKAGPNGTTVHQVNLGYATDFLDLMRFVQTTTTIHVGDTVQWLANTEGTPHTVTFVSGQQEPDTILTEPQQGGPPKLVLNPKVTAPAGGSTYDGTGFTSSGMINGAKDPAPGPRTYSLTFTKAGTYNYICMLHDNMGMQGTIKVVAAGLPLTGDAPQELPVTGGTSPWTLPILGLALLAAGLAEILHRRRLAATRN